MSNYKTQYNEQRKRALGRGIEWQFTSEEWIAWWGTDIEKRGRGKNRLCMARFNDTGAYAPANTYKATNSQNGRDARLNNTKKVDPDLLSRTVKAAWKLKPASLMKRCMRINTPYGVFESQSKAARQLGVSQGTIGHRMKTQPDLYYKETI